MHLGVGVGVTHSSLCAIVDCPSIPSIYHRTEPLRIAESRQFIRATTDFVADLDTLVDPVSATKGEATTYSKQGTTLEPT
jgi:hypothetical protein